jgi:hypothetical protein
VRKDGASTAVSMVCLLGDLFFNLMTDGGQDL